LHFVFSSKPTQRRADEKVAQPSTDKSHALIGTVLDAARR
jgi:hypothetical protein